MISFIHRSSCALLAVVFCGACLFHYPAAAEAYCSRATQRSNLWRHQQIIPIQKGQKAPQLHAFNSNQSVRASGSTNSPENDKLWNSNQLSPTSLRAGGAATSPDKYKLWTSSFKRELLAEMIGTAIIVCLGTGAVMSAIFTDSLVGLFQIASVWIIAVTIAIATTGSISGAHLNPAISFAFSLFRNFPKRKVIPYCLAQLLGAVLASFTNLLLYASKISEYEKLNNIVRGTAESIVSCKAFGEYFE